MRLPAFLTLLLTLTTPAAWCASAAPPCWTPALTRVLVAYVSDSGRTAELAGEVALGAAVVPGTCVWSLDISAASTDIVRDADAIILGSPVHNANPASKMLAWIERWPFKTAPLQDKLGAAFVTAGGISAGEETTQLALLHAMLEFGMVVTGGADWHSSFGASAIVNGEVPFAGPIMNPYFVDKARALGGRIATLAKRMRGSTAAASNK